MIKKFNIKFKVKNEILALTILIILTSIFTIYHNQTKNRINNNYKKIKNNLIKRSNLVIVIGGDGSMSILTEIAKRGVLNLSLIHI